MLSFLHLNFLRIYIRPQFLSVLFLVQSIEQDGVATGLTIVGSDATLTHFRCLFFCLFFRFNRCYRRLCRGLGWNYLRFNWCHWRT